MPEPEISSLLLEAAQEVQAKLDALYAQLGVPIPDSPLDQAGLRDGLEIVEDYVRHGEFGVALEHLVYMICEPEIAISPDSLAKLRSAALQLQMPHAIEGVRTRSEP